MTADKAKRALRALSDSTKAKFLAGFFKTGKGQYAEGDRFLGVVVPDTRVVARKFLDLSDSEIEKLLASPFHEDRLLGLIIWTLQFKRAPVARQKKIFTLYLKNTPQINNWDLVDVSCSIIVGGFLANQTDRSQLDRLAKSKSLWERRIAIVSTFAFIRLGQLADTLRLSETLLNDSHDLIHKAVGWMLREVGKRDELELVAFLRKHHRRMPRTALRYSLERLSATQKKFFMAAPK